jgi:hypothetical protein
MPVQPSPACLAIAQATNRLQNLLGQNASSGLTAQGQSVTNSSLTTTFGGEVVDVLPNGMLVVQATRQLTFSQQTQLIKLRGLVRPEDVSAQNQVLSTAMTDLELEVTGQGHHQRLHLPSESDMAVFTKAARLLSRRKFGWDFTEGKSIVKAGRRRGLTTLRTSLQMGVHRFMREDTRPA